MRSFHLVSSVGVAIVAAWLAVTNLAHAGDFTCKVPWSGSTDCNFVTFDLPPQATLTIEVYSVRRGKTNIDKPAIFFLEDAKNDHSKLTDLTIRAGASGSWKNPNKETTLTIQLRVNVIQGDTVEVRGGYVVTK